MFDAALAVLLSALLLPSDWPSSIEFLGQPARLNSTALYLVLTLGITLPLAFRRLYPTWAAATAYTVGLAQLVLGIPLLPSTLVLIITLFSLTAYGPRWANRVGIVGALVGSSIAGILVASLTSGGLLEATIFASLAITAFVAAWSLGLVRRTRIDRIESLEDRARRLEIERDQQALIGAAAERARIAREMHDIVAHSLTVMIAQADGGRYAAAADPEAPTRALATIAETGRAALADMRRLLGVLRVDPSTTEQEAAADTTPQPAEGDLEALVDQVRETGLRVSLARVGTPRQLPPGAGLTLYRIAQESLTNVLKHAGPDPSVTVLVAWGPASVVLEVSDDGRGASAEVERDGLGRGLRGMAERAGLFGGTVTAGPKQGGGYRVRAELPTPPEGNRA